jgi:hypothetical protein
MPIRAALPVVTRMNHGSDRCDRVSQQRNGVRDDESVERDAWA